MAKANNIKFCLGKHAGAALFVSLELAKKLQTGQIVMIAPDRGEKYVSTALFQ